MMLHFLKLQQIFCCNDVGSIVLLTPYICITVSSNVFNTVFKSPNVSGPLPVIFLFNSVAVPLINHLHLLNLFHL